ncbi:MAG: site-specific integrase [Defluviitaleaceae bacterium]|nr:site-specific integrase [Defluviitaleaceae bacterium]
MARKERGVYRRKDGRYEARFIKGRDDNGKAVYGAVYARSYADVKMKLAAAKQSLQAVKGNSASRSVSVEIKSYLASIQGQVKPSTHGIYVRYFENYISPHFGNMPCGQMTLEKAQAFVDKQLESGLSAITVQSVFNFLKNGLRSAFHQDEIFSVKLPKSIPAEVAVLSVDEQKRLESVAKSSDSINRVGIILCLYTGIRIGELCGLFWTDIDFDRRMLYVRRTLQRIKNADGTTKTEIACLTPKSNSSHRSIPLPEFLISLLKEHRETSTCTYVISRNENPIEPRNMQYRLKKLLIVAEIKSVNFHAATRHTFATRALENGFDIKTLSEILGHSSAVITLKKYAHSMDEHKRKSMESLAALYQ